MIAVMAMRDGSDADAECGAGYSKLLSRPAPVSLSAGFAFEEPVSAASRGDDDRSAQSDIAPVERLTDVV